MSLDNPAFVSFEPRSGRFAGFLSMEAVIGSEADPEIMLREATEIYQGCVSRMRSLLVEIDTLRSNRVLIPARKIWQLGHVIFVLREELARLGLQLDGVYDHLTRDLGVKRKWLEKVVIFRRYIPEEGMIPESLNWGRCEKGTARMARRLSKGLPPG